MKRLIYFLIFFAVSCGKTELQDIHTHKTADAEKTLFTTYWELKQTPLQNYDWTDGGDFLEVIEGTWTVLQVIAITDEGEIQHHDYSISNFEYHFSNYCRYHNTPEMVCQYTSNNEIDPSGIYAVQQQGETEWLFAQPDENALSGPGLFNSTWGEVYFWPTDPTVMVVFNVNTPHWIFMKKVITE